MEKQESAQTAAPKEVSKDGCGNKQDVVPSSNVTSKDSTVSNIAANGGAVKVSTSGSVNYDLAKATYTDKNIKINYPQMGNLSDSGKQKKINELIKTSVFEVLNEFKDELSSLN